MDDLLSLMSPGERGDPMSPLRWTCKSLRRLAAELRERGHRISHTVVGELLKRCNFSLQANRKTREGDDHPDRDAQFEYINRRFAGGASAGDLGRHEEEGACWRLQEPRPGVAPARRARRGPGA